MKRFDLTGVALYVSFGIVLSASGHSLEDFTYWLLFTLVMAVDVHSYGNGMKSGSEITKKVWGIK